MVLVYLAELYRQQGGCILFVTPTQKSADTVLDYVLKVCPWVKPVRVYRKHDEEAELRKSGQVEFNDADIMEQAIEITIIMAMRRDKREKVFGRSQYSLARTMMERALSQMDLLSTALIPRRLLRNFETKSTSYWLGVRI